jgi:pyruvate dehydrogenase E2 component (dihydrolipoamide acetyltransferase)
MVDTEPKIIPVMVPDIGDFDEVEVIEVLVNAGDELSAEDSIITLESDKASMEISLCLQLALGFPWMPCRFLK